MKRFMLCLLLLGLACTAWAQSVTTIAIGLNGPRGLAFGPDGALYVAEAGMGGTGTGFDCEQVPAPVGPAFGGPSARVSRIANGTRETVVSGLPSTMSSLPTQDTSGASDVAFLGSNMYVLLAGGGCSHGNPNSPNGIVRAKVFQGTWGYVADLSTYLKNNPTAVVEAYDFEPDGVFFSMVVHNGMFYAVEPNHGDIVRVNPGGRAERFIDITATQGHAVPTAIAYHGASSTSVHWDSFRSPRGRRRSTSSRSRGRSFPPFPDLRRSLDLLSTAPGDSTR